MIAKIIRLEFFRPKIAKLLLNDTPKNIKNILVGKNPGLRTSFFEQIA